MNQYLSYTSLGMQYAINVELAVDSVDNVRRQEKYIGVALTVTALIAVILALTGLAIQYFEIPLFEKYSFNQYALALGVIVGMTHLKEILTNVYRVHGKLVRIMIGEFLFAFIPLLAALTFRGEALITALLFAMAGSSLISLVVYLVKAPFKIVPQLDRAASKYLLVIGIPLLIYNLSFALMTIAGRTIVSIFYSVETMGFFAMANSITVATLLGLRAVIWVVFPRVLSRTRLGLPDEEVASTVKKLNDLYSTAVFLAVFVMILSLPLLFAILPQYKPAAGVLTVLLLTQAVLSIVAGYNAVAIARKRQMMVAAIAIIAVIFIVVFGGFFAWLQWDYVWVAVAMLGGGFVYTILQARLGTRLIYGNNSPQDYLYSILPVGSIIAIVLVLVGVFTEFPWLFSGLGLLVFIWTRREAIGRLWAFSAAKLSAGR
jgi:O-antigen/teichoic acid export membrane protein